MENDEKNKGKKITDIVSVIIRSTSLNQACTRSTVDLTRTRSTFYQIKIAEKYNLSEQTQMNFSVDNSIHRIVIDIDGNVSNALLRIPTSKFSSLKIFKIWSREIITKKKKGNKLRKYINHLRQCVALRTTCFNTINTANFIACRKLKIIFNAW